MEENKISLRDFLESDSFKSIFSAVFCCVIGIALGFIILLIINAEHAPKAIATILKGFMYFSIPLKKAQYLGMILVQAVPLVLCSLSVLFAYKAGLFNIGVGGQYCFGAGVSLWCALGFHLPWYCCVLAAMVAAGLWGAINGALKAFFNINEVIGGIMMNWTGLYLVNVMTFNDKVMNMSKSETYSIAATSPSSLIPKCGLDHIFGNNHYVSIAIPITVLIAIIIMIILEKTTFGYELKATGLNKNAAKYAGMNDKSNIIVTMAIAGAIAGLAASFFYLCDFDHWKIASSVPAIGFNGIAVAFLGGLNPIGVIFAGYFIQHITFGGSLIDMHYFNPEISSLISSIIIYACAFVLFFKNIVTKFTSGEKK